MRQNGAACSSSSKSAKARPKRSHAHSCSPVGPMPMRLVRATSSAYSESMRLARIRKRTPSRTEFLHPRVP